MAGHKKSGDLEDNPEAIAFTSGYITAFESARAASSDADGLVAALKQRYPDAALDKILTRSARAAFPN